MPEGRAQAATGRYEVTSAAERQPEASRLGEVKDVVGGAREAQQTSIINIGDGTSASQATFGSTETPLQISQRQAQATQEQS